MTDQILLHQKTQKQLSAILENPPHAILLVGQAGSGKRSLTAYLAAALTGVPTEKLSNHPYFIELSRPEGKSEIPIEAVRQLLRTISLKTGGARRVVAIYDAHQMSEEAQNALLKNIEEPPQNTVFILSVTSLSQILPTIASRSQKVVVAPVTKEDARGHFIAADLNQIDSAWSLSRGSAGLLSSLLSDDSEHDVRKAVDQAKEFLGQDRYKRLLFLDNLSGSRENLELFLDGLSRVLGALSDAAVARDNEAQVNRLLKARLKVQVAAMSLKANSSVRLIGLDLALSLNI
jgi:DNA polymerase-3 subunit delta'